MLPLGVSDTAAQTHRQQQLVNIGTRLPETAIVSGTVVCVKGRA